MDAQLRLIPRIATTDPATSHPATEAPERPGTETASTTTARTAPARRGRPTTGRERGRAGISRAREVLRNSRRPLPHSDHVTAA